MKIGNPSYRYFLPLYKPYKGNFRVFCGDYFGGVSGSKPLFAEYYDPLAIPTEELFKKIDSFNPRKDEDVLRFCNTFGLPGLRKPKMIKDKVGFLYNLERDFSVEKADQEEQEGKSRGQFYLRRHYKFIFDLTTELSHFPGLKVLQSKYRLPWGECFEDKLKKTKAIELEPSTLSDPSCLSDYIYDMKDFRLLPDVKENDVIIEFHKDGVFFQDIENIRQDISSIKDAINAFLSEDVSGTYQEKPLVWYINRFLEGLQMKLSYTQKEGKVHNYRYSTFAQALGAHFLEANLTKIGYRRCLECNNPIEITHGRLRFCPKDEHSKRSLCEKRYNMRKKRKRDNKSKKGGLNNEVIQEG